MTAAEFREREVDGHVEAGEVTVFDDGDEFLDFVDAIGDDE